MCNRSQKHTLCAPCTRQPTIVQQQKRSPKDEPSIHMVDMDGEPITTCKSLTAWTGNHDDEPEIHDGNT